MVAPQGCPGVKDLGWVGLEGWGGDFNGLSNAQRGETHLHGVHGAYKSTRTVRTREAKRYAPPRRDHRCAFFTRRHRFWPPRGATTSHCGARAPCSAPSARALAGRQSLCASLQAQAAVQRCAADSRLAAESRQLGAPGVRCRRHRGKNAVCISYPLPASAGGTAGGESSAVTLDTISIITAPGTTPATS